MKEELVRLYYHNGMWIASLYNRESGYFHDERFLFYSKKDVIYKLRHELGVKVGRDFCSGNTTSLGYSKSFWNELAV